MDIDLRDLSRILEGIVACASLISALVFLWAASMAGDREARCIRVWVGFTFLAIGILEFLDSIYQEGDGVAIYVELYATTFHALIATITAVYLIQLGAKRLRR